MDSILIPSCNGSSLELELKLIGKTPGQKIDNAIAFIAPALKSGDEIRVTFTYKENGSFKINLPLQVLAGGDDPYAGSG